MALSISIYLLPFIWNNLGKAQLRLHPDGALTGMLVPHLLLQSGPACPYFTTVLSRGARNAAARGRKWNLARLPATCISFALPSPSKAQWNVTLYGVITKLILTPRPPPPRIWTPKREIPPLMRSAPSCLKLQPILPASASLLN